MAKGAITVKIDGKYDDKDLNRAIKDLQALKTQSGALASPMQSLGKAALAAGAGFASFMVLGKVADFMGDAAQAAMDEEKSVRALSQAFDNLGVSSQLLDAERGVARLSKMAAVADDELRPALQALVTATGDVGRSQELLETALDASAATGRSLESIVLGISKASTGQVAALRKLGIPLDDNIVKTKDFGAAIDVMNAKFGGQAAEAANTYAGRMKSVAIAADEAKEVIGFALLDAIDNASESFGGTGGINEAIAAAGDKVADLVAGVGSLTTSFIDLATQSFNLAGATEEGGTSLADVTLSIGKLLPVTSQLIGAYTDLTAEGERINDARAAEQRMIDTTANRYTALAVSMDPAKANLLGLAGASEDVADEMEKAKTASDRLKESFDRYSLGDNVILALREVAKAARDAKGDLTSNKDAAIDLRGEFGTAASAILDFAVANGTSAANVLALWDDGIGKLRKNLIRNGVKPADVDAFINERAWMTRFTLLADVIGNGRAAEAMRLAGLAVGKATWQGMVQGLDSGRAQVATSAAQLAAGARYAAQADLEINSPSKKFIEIGKSVGEGFGLGIDAGQAGVVASAKAIVKQALDAAKSERDAAMAAMRGVSDSIVGSVLGNVGFSTTDAEGNALTPQQIMQSILGSTANQQQAVTAIAANIGAKLPPELLAKILQMPPETAVALANYLGGAEGSAMLAQLTTNYATLATETETLLGGPMGLAWGKVGDQSARDMLIAARATIAELAPGFANFVRSQLSVGADVVASITGVAEGIAGKRAAGGPVSGGSTYLVGERGPELVTMGGDGFVTPNHALGSRGGNTYAVSVYVAPGGDLAGAGRQMVEAIRAYERSSGKVYAAA